MLLEEKQQFKELPRAARFGYSVGKLILSGALAGMFGGIGYGLLTIMFSPYGIAGFGVVVGVSDAVGSWGYHLFNSIVIGAMFGFVLGPVVVQYRDGLLWGLFYGAIWYVLGGMTLYPLMLGQFSSVLNFSSLVDLSSGAWLFLVGHLAYGLITGLGTVWLREKLRFRSL